jgi:thiol-disulfide isomerase/thioredoxin
MKSVKKYFPWFVRILISGLFFLSAFTKIYPVPSFHTSITTFEISQLVPMGFTMEVAGYFSRIIIGIEFAIGILLLFPYNIKKIIIPATIFMLAVFSVHLTIEIFTTGNQGNCGCFGTLLPMTPLQALLKNLISIGLLLFILIKFSDSINENRNMKYFLIISNVITICILSVFMLTHKYTKTKFTPVPDSTAIHDTVYIDSIKGVTTDNVVIDVKRIGPPSKKSAYSQYFENIDKGKKILCFFAPTCDHCMATAQELTELKKADPNFPELKIIFMDEAAEEIPNFFKFAGAEYPYLVLDIISFWGAIGKMNNTPGVVYLWNGNVQKFYNGTEKDKFNKVEFKNIVKK